MCECVWSYLCESVWSYCVSVCVCNYCMLSLCVSVKLLYCGECVCVKLLYVKFVCVWSYCMCECVWKMVCDKVVCERWFVTRWCVTKLYVKDGVWQRSQSRMWKMVCDKMVCDKVVCERWCVTKVVCERWCVTKLYVKDSVWQEAGGGGGGGGHPGYRIKNKNPTQRCGEQSNKTLVAMPHDHEFAHSQSESSS